MLCTKCRQELPESAAFCPNCGTRAGSGERRQTDEPLYLAEVKGLLRSGRLAVYRDRVEFSASSTQKTVFNYDSLMAVKKRLLPTPAILFITEDARTEACAATSKNIHEAFLHVEQAVKPYIEERRARLEAQGIRYSFLSSMGMTNSGILNVAEDHVAFQSKSGQREEIPYQNVRTAAAPAGALELSLWDGEIRSFSLERELREEVPAFIRQAIAPYLQERKEALLARGIYYSFPTALGQERGTADISAGAVTFTGAAGRTEAVDFRDVRTAGLCGDVLELSLTDGTARSLTVVREEAEEILAFVKEAIDPYVKLRTEGFDASFGGDERIEINRGRGVFHILRQNGTVITEEWPLEDLVTCQLAESTELNPMINGLRLGSKALASKAAEAVGRQGAPEEEDTVRSVDILLTVRSGEGRRTEAVRFGDFPLGVRRSHPKYTQCAAEAAGLMDCLAEACPGCQRVLPEPPEPKPPLPVPESHPGEPGELVPASPAALEPVPTTAPAQERDPLGVQKYIRRISQYIGTCPTPMTIAFQGNAAVGEGTLMKKLSAALEDGEHQIWLHTKQLARSDLGEKLPMFIGATLVSQLGTASDGRVVKFAKAFINLSVTMISQGKADGQFFIDAFFKDNPTNSLEDLVRTFSELVRKRGGKVVVLVDGLENLSPAKTAEVLEAMEDFFDCEGCVFVVAVGQDHVVRGMDERYGPGSERGRDFFNRTFRVSFRLPASGFQMEPYVESRLEQMGLTAVRESETALYCDLASRSVGSSAEPVRHLFDSFQLLQTLADEELYTTIGGRLTLFGLLCMQSRFRPVYDYLVQLGGSATPELLSGLCDGESEAVLRSGLAQEAQSDFQSFAQLFCGILGDGSTISQQACGRFTQILEFSSITSR